METSMIPTHYVTDSGHILKTIQHFCEPGPLNIFIYLPVTHGK